MKGGAQDSQLGNFLEHAITNERNDDGIDEERPTDSKCVD
jgi:hypothetical protein